VVDVHPGRASHSFPGILPDAPVWFLFAAFVNDSLKGLLAAFLLRRGAGQNMWFDGLRGFVKYGLVAIGLALLSRLLAERRPSGAWRALLDRLETMVPG